MLERARRRLGHPAWPAPTAEAPKHKGISFFLLDMTPAGVEVRPLRQMTGEAEFDEVFLTDVEMPGDALLGPQHGGWGVGMGDAHQRARPHRRVGISVSSAGSSRWPRCGSATSTPVERQRLAELLGRGNAFRAMAQRQGPVASIAGVADEARHHRADVRRRRCCAPTSPAPTPCSTGRDAAGMLAAPGGRIAGGTSQVQRNIIGERLLGLPREPK